MSDISSVSIVKTLDAIIDKKISDTQEITTAQIVLYKTGSTLTPVSLGKVSY